MNNNPPCITYQGACFWEKSKSGFPNPKTDHESIKFTLRVDYSDQIQIRIFEIPNLSVFLGKDLKNVFLTSGFFKKRNGMQQTPYMYDILTENNVGGTSLNLNHQLHIISCLSSIQIISRLFLNPYLSGFFVRNVVSAYACLFSK